MYSPTEINIILKADNKDLLNKLEESANKLKEVYTSAAQASVLGGKGFISLKQAAGELGVSAEKLEKEFSKMHEEIISLGEGKGYATMNKLTGAITPLGVSALKASYNLKRFKMEWLSIMFFSMNVYRSLNKLMFSSISTFMKIAGETNRTNQSLAVMASQFTYLKFTLGSAIGEALEPLLPTLIDITQTIVDFIDEHPEEVFWGLATALVVAFSAFTIGQIKLFADAIAWVLPQLEKLSKYSKGIGLAGAITFGISDILFDQQGDFELDKKFAASAFAAMLMKKGMKLKGGIWTFSILSVIEFVQDPEGTGKFVADVANWLFGIADTVVKIFDDVKNYLYSKLTGTEFVPSDTLKNFGKGFSERIEELDKEGKLSSSLAAVYYGLSNNEDAFDKATKKANFFTETVESSALKLLPLIENLGFMLGSPTKGSFPLVFSLIQAEIQWVQMKDIAVAQIDAIIQKLNEIPKEIVTIHRVITVYETRDERGSISAILQTRR